MSPGLGEAGGHEESWLLWLVRLSVSSCWARSVWTVSSVRFSSDRTWNSSSRRAISTATRSSSTSSASNSRLIRSVCVCVCGGGVKHNVTVNAHTISPNTKHTMSLFYHSLLLHQNKMRQVCFNMKVHKGHIWQQLKTIDQFQLNYLNSNISILTGLHQWHST